MADVINIAQLKKVNSLAHTLNKHGLAANRMDAADLAREINGKEETDYLSGLRVNEEQQWEVANTANGQQVIQETKKMPVSSDLMTREQVEGVLQKFCNLFSEEIYGLNAKIHGMELKFSYLQERLEGFEPGAGELDSIPIPETPVSGAPHQESPLSGAAHQESPVPEEFVPETSNSETFPSYPEQQTKLHSQKEPENNMHVEVRPVEPAQEFNVVQQVAAHGSGRPPQQVEQDAVQQRSAINQQAPVNSQQNVEQPAPKPVDSNGNPRTGGYDSEDVSVEKFFYFGSK